MHRLALGQDRSCRYSCEKLANDARTALASFLLQCNKSIMCQQLGINNSTCHRTLRCSRHSCIIIACTCQHLVTFGAQFLSLPFFDTASTCSTTFVELHSAFKARTWHSQLHCINPGTTANEPGVNGACVQATVYETNWIITGSKTLMSFIAPSSNSDYDTIDDLLSTNPQVSLANQRGIELGNLVLAQERQACIPAAMVTPLAIVARNVQATAGCHSASKATCQRRQRLDHSLRA